MKTEETPDSLQQMAKEKLEVRTNRLRRMVALNAPVLILMAEIQLIQDALTIMDPGAVADIQAGRQQRDVRRRWGLCMVQSCDRRTDAGSDLCAHCLAEADAEIDALGLDFDEPQGLPS